MSFSEIAIPYSDERVCWMQISEVMRDTSVALRDPTAIDDVQNHIIDLFDHLFHISAQYNLDMNKAWDRWHKKAKSKRYDNHSES